MDNQTEERDGLSAREKFGSAIDGGFQAVPDVLLKHQNKLGLSPVDVVILLNIMMHWWNAHDKPYPRLVTIAQRIGVTPRTVERRISRMEKAKLLRRLPAEKKEKGLSVRRFDLGGIVSRLQLIASDDPVAISRRRRN